MKNTRILLALIITIILSLGVVGQCFASKADREFLKAEKQVAAAENEQKRTDKIEAYQKAIKSFASIQNKYQDTPQAAKALYNVAKLNLTIAEIDRNEKKQRGYLYQAYESCVTLVNLYDKPVSVLQSKNLEDNEIKAIQNTVAQAKVLKDQAANELDKIYSKDIKYKVLDALVKLTGAKPGFSYWFAIILVTVIVKLLMTPLTKAQFKSMKDMQKVAPLVKELQEKYKGDQKTIGEKTMELYKSHNINPAAGCLPLLVQMPILMVIFYTIKAYEFNFAHGSFFWIGSSLSHLASVPVLGRPGVLVWVTAKNLAEPDLILLVLYLVSMYVSTKISSVSADPAQASQQKMMAVMMPLMFAFMFASFPSAFLLYWLIFNIMQTAQQYLILKVGPNEAVEAAAPAPALEPEIKPESDERIRRRRRKR